MRFRGNKRFASAVGLVLGLLCAVEAAKDISMPLDRVLTKQKKNLADFIGLGDMD